MPESTAEPRLAHDLRWPVDARRISIRIGNRHVAQSLVRTASIVILNELGYEIAQVAFAEDNEVIETLPFY